MQFLRSIKSAKALGLAAASVATMMAANVAPTLAQTQASATRTVTFVHQGGYVADYFITFPGQTRAIEALGVPLGQSRSFRVPAAANVTVTQQMSHNRQVYFQRSFRLNNNTCFKNFGTIFNPSAGNC
jgi:hypothetical protein